MSRENVVIVRAALDAANRDDWEAVFHNMTPGFELDFSRAVGPVIRFQATAASASRAKRQQEGEQYVPRYRLSVYRLRSHAGGLKRLRAVEEIVLADD